jgi:hypothetical protein
MQFEDFPADILLYLLGYLGLDDALLLLSVCYHIRFHVHCLDIPDCAGILDLHPPTKTVRQPVTVDSDSAANPIR